MFNGALEDARCCLVFLFLFCLGTPAASYIVRHRGSDKGTVADLWARWQQASLRSLRFAHDNLFGVVQPRYIPLFELSHEASEIKFNVSTFSTSFDIVPLSLRHDPNPLRSSEIEDFRVPHLVSVGDLTVIDNDQLPIAHFPQLRSVAGDVQAHWVWEFQGAVALEQLQSRLFEWYKQGRD